MEANGKTITSNTKVPELLQLGQLVEQVSKIKDLRKKLDIQLGIIEKVKIGGLSSENYLKNNEPVLYKKALSAQRYNEAATSSLNELIDIIKSKTLIERLRQLNELRTKIKQAQSVLKQQIDAISAVAGYDEMDLFKDGEARKCGYNSFSEMHQKLNEYERTLTQISLCRDALNNLK